MRAQVVPAHAWRMIMPARPLQRLLATLRPVMEWSDLLAERQRAQSLRRELKGCGRLQMPHFTAKDVAHRTLVVKQVPWPAPSPGVEGWLGS